MARAGVAKRARQDRPHKDPGYGREVSKEVQEVAGVVVRASDLRHANPDDRRKNERDAEPSESTPSTWAAGERVGWPANGDRYHRDTDDEPSAETHRLLLPAGNLDQRIRERPTPGAR
jgi:hypothetical protein